MPSLPIPVFGVPLGVPVRLVLLGGLCHLVVGLVFVGASGISGRWARLWRREIGSGVVEFLAALCALVAVVVLWPAAAVCRAQAWRRSRGVRDEDLIWRRAVVMPLPRGPLPVAGWVVPPLWFRRQYEAASALLARGMVREAQVHASRLVDASREAFGSGHPFTLDAFELLALVARRGHGVSSVPGWEAESDGVYCTAPCQVSTTVW